MTLPEPTPVAREPAEPRFAGSSPAASAGPAPATVDYWRTPEGFPAGPAEESAAGFRSGSPSPTVDYGDDLDTGLADGPDGDVERMPAWASRGAGLVAVVGGALAVAGSFLTWATLHITALDSAATGVNDSNPDVSYQGLTLLEGRAALVGGVLAVVLAGLLMLGRFRARPLPAAITVVGGVELVVAVFTAIAHPAELATLFRSYQTVGAIKVGLPNGPGVWLAIVGAALILIGGLLAYSADRRPVLSGLDEPAVNQLDIDQLEQHDIKGYG